MTILNKNEITYENLVNLINLENKKLNKILLFGIGGSGINTLNSFDNNNDSIELVVASSNLNKLDKSKLKNKLFLGKKKDGETIKVIAGFDPSVGKILAENNIEEIEKYLFGKDLIITVGGMSGGTATGVIPVILKKAKELNIPSIAIITTPFSYEGSIRKELAEEGVEKIKEMANATIIYNNEELVEDLKNKPDHKNILLELDLLICGIINNIINTLIKK